MRADKGRTVVVIAKMHINSK